MVGLFSSHANKIGEAHTALLKDTPVATAPATAPPVRKTCPRVSPEKATRIVEGYKAGKTVYELADEHRINPVTVSEVLKREGVKLRRQPPTDDQIRQMTHLYESGVSLKKVGDRLGFNATTIHSNLRKAGVKNRDSNGRE